MRRDDDAFPGEFVFVIIGLVMIMAFVVVETIPFWWPEPEDPYKNLESGLRDKMRNHLQVMNEYPVTENDERFLPEIRPLVPREPGRVLEAFAYDAVGGGDAAISFLRTRSDPLVALNLCIVAPDRACYWAHEDDLGRLTQAREEQSTIVNLPARHVRVTPQLSHASDLLPLPVDVAAVNQVTPRAQLYLTTTATLGAGLLAEEFQEGARTNLKSAENGRATMIMDIDPAPGNNANPGGPLMRYINDAEIDSKIVPFRFVLTSAPPSGGSITWHVPRGWEMPANIDEAFKERDGWRWSGLVANQEAPFSFTLTRLAGNPPPPVDSVIEFSLVPPPSPDAAWQVMPVLFEGGLRGYQEFVIEYESKPVTLAEPRVLLHVPDALPTLADGFFGVAVANGPDPTTLASLRVEGPAGVALFQSAGWWDGAPAEGGAPALLADGSGFVYEPAGGISLPAYEVREFAFKVRALDGAMQDGRLLKNEPASDEPYRATLHFPANGYSEVVYRAPRTAGVLHADVLPATQGLGFPAGRADGFPRFPVATPADPPFEIRAVYGSGDGAFTHESEFHVVTLDADAALGLREGLRESRFSASPSWQRLGAMQRAGNVRLEARWEALITDLAEAGAGEPTDDLRVYQPLSFGRVANPQWHASEASGLRRGIVAVAFGDVTGDGSPESVFASEDGNVYALEPVTHAEVFTYPTEADNILDVAASGEGRLIVVLKDGRVLVRDGAGVVRELVVASSLASASFDGLPAYFVVAGGEETCQFPDDLTDCLGWVHRVDVPTWTSDSIAQTLLPITRVAAASSWGASEEPWVAAATLDGAVTAWANDGTQLFTISGFDGSPAALSVAQAIGGARRDVAVATDAGEYRVEPGDAGESGISSTQGGVGGVFAAFVPDLGGGAVRDAAFGDAERLRVVDGGTGALLWTAEYPVLPNTADDGDCLQDEPSLSNLHYSALPCTLAERSRATLDVVGDGARVLAAWRNEDGRAAVAAFDGGAAAWTPGFVDLGVAASVALALGEHAVLGSVLLVGDANGFARLHDADDGAEVWEEGVSALTGVFTYRVGMPEGAFLGSYLVESELSWESADALGAAFTQRARLLGSFDATDAAGGAPVTYSLTLSGGFQDAPRAQG